MQPTSGGGGSGGGGGGGSLQRFRSAPATWLEALLESELDNDVILEAPAEAISSPPRKVAQLPPPHPPPPRTPPSSSISRHPSADLSFLDSAGAGGAAGAGLTGFLRQNSSPAEFLSAINSEAYFSTFGMGTNLDYLLPSAQSASKRPRQLDLDASTAKLASSPMKVEQTTELQSGAGGLLDSELENLTEDAVLCRVRAKRGCATHPRSIAERVRRTRISDRIRKLQELVPNMDKQTNTADMLDEAVEYVKFLQKQIQELTEHQKRCRCSMKE